MTNQVNSEGTPIDGGIVAESHNQRVTDVIFDFCGVLVDLDYRPCLQGHSPADVVDKLCADEDDVYGFFAAEARMDAGEDFAVVIKDYRRDYGDDLATMFRYYIEHYDDALPRMIPGMERLLNDLSDHGYRLWGLTNWSGETFHFAFEKFPQIKKLLGGTIVSGAEKMHKPNADIYELALSRFGLDAGHCVFFDDTAANVAGAEAVGINGCRFTGADDARKQLKELGVHL
ncbi:HAD family phosphatase [Bifidobacterium sp. ESL0790]|uniref:HAD family hydrolase n=1 Tax=Bifidobacterium sp. ESL0790 TaxID=2983233 RepID=UPI0023F74986|nr:HAD family phosphatase [Bifidobacterium sp. ESL0790]WEV71684.1 HAD family phosphatase [Bifidobacterium sp. ESL0790]